MSTDAKRRIPVALLMAVYAAILMTTGPAAANDTATDEPRHSSTRQYAGDGRESSAPKVTTNDHYAPLVTAGERTRPDNASGNEKLSGAQAASQSPGNDFWIFYADVQLFNDDDHDGYYHGIDVLFDADTVYEEADVYAVLYLSYEGGPWNEYATTDTFRIFGATSDDEYVVVTELMTGYPRGSYDLLIDLYDTFDGQLVATYGPDDTSEFFNLPLEDFNRDDPLRGNSVVVVEKGGGAVDVWTILATLMYVLAVYLVRRRQRMH